MTSKILLDNSDKIFRGHIVSPVTDVEILDIENGAMVVDRHGKIKAVCCFDDLKDVSKDVLIVDYGQKLLFPGFIDMHLHLPQIAQTGRSGEHLLKWLEKYIFPAEARFSDIEHARVMANWFFDELLRNGTTTACVFTTIHKDATDAAFEVAKQKGNRVIMGKVLMDTNCPDELREEVEAGIDESLELLDKWHMVDDGRLMYAFVPRFAVTSTSKLMNKVSQSWLANKGTYMHTHLAESFGEIEFVKELFPRSRSYVEVYHDHGLVHDHSIFAHAIHLDESDMELLKVQSSSLAHCPSSNFFLKSGIFKYNRIREAQIKFGLGSDVAAGPQMSMFQVMKDANYIQAEDWLDARELFYRATLGSARALNLEEKVGSLSSGKEADFIVCDPTRRNAIANDMLENEIDDVLSALVFLGDDRLIEATYVRGFKVYDATKETVSV